MPSSNYKNLLFHYWKGGQQSPLIQTGGAVKCSVQNSVRRALQSPLTDLSPRMGPFLVRLTLEKWALSRLTIISSNFKLLC